MFNMVTVAVLKMKTRLSRVMYTSMHYYTDIAKQVMISLGLYESYAKWHVNQKYHQIIVIFTTVKLWQHWH